MNFQRQKKKFAKKYDSLQYEDILQSRTIQQKYVLFFKKEDEYSRRSWIPLLAHKNVRLSSEAKSINWNLSVLLKDKEKCWRESQDLHITNVLFCSK